MLVRAVHSRFTTKSGQDRLKGSRFPGRLLIIHEGCSFKSYPEIWTVLPKRVWGYQVDFSSLMRAVHSIKIMKSGQYCLGG